MIIFSDAHLHTFTDLSPNRLEIQNNVLEHIFQHSNNTDKVILFCGDLTHKHGYIPTVILDMLIDLFTKYPDVIMYAISGNHDQVYKNTLESPSVSSISILSKILPNLICVDNRLFTLLDYNILAIPYYTKTDDFYKVLEIGVSDIKEQHLSNTILMLHQTPTNLYNSFIPAEVDLANKDVEIFDYVFMGHIHQHQDFGNNRFMVGNPVIQDASDYRQDKGYMELLEGKVTFHKVKTELTEILTSQKDAIKVVIKEKNETTKPIDSRFSQGLDAQFIAYCEVAGLDEFTKNIGETIINS